MNKRYLFLILLGIAMECSAAQKLFGADLQRLTEKLNSIQTLQAKFEQKNPDGQIMQGMFYLQKPGKMRFEYAGPAKFMLLADGKWLIYYDVQMKEATYLDLNKNPLAILLKNYPDLSHIKDIQIKNIVKHEGAMAVEVFYPQDNTTVILHFNAALTLEGWVTHDPQGTIIDVKLKEMAINEPIANAQKLFSFDRPKRKLFKQDAAS